MHLKFVQTFCHVAHQSTSDSRCSSEMLGVTKLTSYGKFEFDKTEANATTTKNKKKKKKKKKKTLTFFGEKTPVIVVFSVSSAAWEVPSPFDL